MAGGYPTLAAVKDPTRFRDSKSGRALMAISRDMDLKEDIFHPRKRNEQILALHYQDSTPHGGQGVSRMGGQDQWANLRENALNFPYRRLRWIESQAVSKNLIVKVNRDAGPGQKAAEEGMEGPGDADTHMWLGIMLTRVALEAGFKREMRAVVNEVEPRGTSVLRIGYHVDSATEYDMREAGKDAQSIVADAMLGDLEPKEGQDHVAISKGLKEIAGSERFTLSATPRQVQNVLDRAYAHDQAAEQEETSDRPQENTRPTRRRVYMQKLRVGEDCGWAPWTTDTFDTPFWWQRVIWTVSQVKRAKNLFKRSFRREVKGYDGRNVSGMFKGGKTPSTDDMGSESRQAQTEIPLDDDERFVEFYEIWYRRPDMRAGGIRKIVAPEFPDEFVERDDSNPYVDEDGYGLIPGFYPFYDFTPIQSSLQIPERTAGIPPMGVGMPQFEKLAEYNRIRQEAALKGATSIIQIHPGLKDKKKVLDAINRGDIRYAFIADMSLIGPDGKMQKAVEAHSFSGVNPEIENAANIERKDWSIVSGMPPAVINLVGTAATATQDQQGIGAGERESGAYVSYMEDRMADVMGGIRGLVRGCYDDEDFQAMLGAEGAQVLKAWQTATEDVGDEITCTFGARAQAQETVEKKQFMEAITLVRTDVEPLTGIQNYDVEAWVEELCRLFNVGPPKKNDGPMRKLQEMVIKQAQQIAMLTGEEPGKSGTPAGGGPNASEGAGPTQANLNAGALNGTVEPASPALAGF